MGRAGLAAYSRGIAIAFPKYPVEAAAALSNSVQADELDDRCGEPRARGAEGGRGRYLATGSSLLICPRREQALARGDAHLLPHAEIQAHCALGARGREPPAHGDGGGGACCVRQSPTTLTRPPMRVRAASACAAHAAGQRQTRVPPCAGPVQAAGRVAGHQGRGPCARAGAHAHAHAARPPARPSAAHHTMARLPPAGACS